jgi:hypothetical protein
MTGSDVTSGIFPLYGSFGFVSWFNALSNEEAKPRRGGQRLAVGEPHGLRWFSKQALKGRQQGGARECDEAGGARCRPFRACLFIAGFRGFLAALVTHG